MVRGDTYSRRRVLTWSTGSLVLLAGCTATADQEADTTSTTSEGAESDCAPASTTARDTGTPSEETTTQDGAESSARIGDVVTGENLSMVVRGTTTTESLGEFSNADEGNEFVAVRLVVKNTSDRYVDFSGHWQSRVKDASNRVYDPSIESTDHPIQSGVLAPGELARGDVVFEVPTDAGGLTMQFDFSAFELFELDRVTVDLGAAADSMSDLGQSLDVDVHSPGDAASHQAVSVRLHGVYRESSLGQFAQAEAGNEYLVPDFEVTNESSEPLTVSTLLQMRVKDRTGLAYTSDVSGTTSLDSAYSEGSDIAPGESRRGELAYQVPADQSCLYWVFNFLGVTEPRKAFWRL